MSVFEQQKPQSCNNPECYLCWLRKMECYTISLPVEIKSIGRVCELKLYDILREVSEVSGVNIDEILSLSRKEKICIARQMFCYIATENKKWTQKQIGAAIRRDHSTVIHSRSVVEDMLNTKQQEYVSLACQLGLVINN